MPRMRASLVLPAAIAIGLCFTLRHVVAPTYAASAFDDCRVQNMPAWPAKMRATAVARELGGAMRGAGSAGNWKEHNRLGKESQDAWEKSNDLQRTVDAQMRDCRAKVSARLKEERKKKRRAELEERKRNQDAGESYSLREDPLVRETVRAYQRATDLEEFGSDVQTLASPDSDWSQQLQSLNNLVVRLNLARPGPELSRELTTDALNRTQAIHQDSLGQLEAAMRNFGTAPGLGTSTGTALGRGFSDAVPGSGVKYDPSTPGNTVTQQFDSAISRIGPSQGSEDPIGLGSTSFDTTGQIGSFNEAMEEIARRYKTRIENQRAIEAREREQAAARERARLEEEWRAAAEREAQAEEEERQNNATFSEPSQPISEPSHPLQRPGMPTCELYRHGGSWCYEYEGRDICCPGGGCYWERALPGCMADPVPG